MTIDLHEETLTIATTALPSPRIASPLVRMAGSWLVMRKRPSGWSGARSCDPVVPERPSPYPWEQDGLDHVKNHMPLSGRFQAGAVFSFTAPSDRVDACDLLIVSDVCHDDLTVWRPAAFTCGRRKAEV